MYWDDDRGFENLAGAAGGVFAFALANALEDGLVALHGERARTLRGLDRRPALAKRQLGFATEDVAEDSGLRGQSGRQQADNDSCDREELVHCRIPVCLAA